MPQFDDNIINTRVSELHHKEEEALIQSMASRYGVQYTDLHGITIDTDALTLLPEETARQAELAIFSERNKSLNIAVRNPTNPKTKEQIDILHGQGYEAVIYLVSPRSLEHAWERYKDATHANAEKKGVLDVDPNAIDALSKEIATHLDVQTKILEVQASNDAAKVSHIIEIAFGGALALGASDIHIEPEKNTIRLRYRIDGVLWDVTDIDQSMYKLINSRLKLLSGLTLNIKDEAQDGRFTFTVGTRSLEIRASVIPGAYGESIVMRLLDPSALSFSLDNLGLNDALHAAITEELARPNGAIITTGPTGSGKTTALYAFMQQVHTSEKKIITIEDPIEYKLDGVVQTQVEDDYTFATGLRAVLRQDPDIIMIGEIRDREVAETAVHAALTGHLVFSTLHTNSAAGAFSRLIDLGVDARSIGSAFNIILGQRLVRKLCEACKVSRDTTTEEQKIIARITGETPHQHTVYESKGCEECGGSGFKGRIGIFEAIRVDAAVESAALSDSREENILEAAATQNIPTMAEDGIQKVLAGVTSLEELARVVDLYNSRVLTKNAKEVNPELP